MCWTLDRVKNRYTVSEVRQWIQGPIRAHRVDKSTFYLSEVAVKMVLKSKRRKA